MRKTKDWLSHDFCKIWPRWSFFLVLFSNVAELVINLIVSYTSSYYVSYRLYSMIQWNFERNRKRERQREGGRINSIKFFNFPYISYDEIDVCHKCLQTIHRMGLYDFHRTIQIQLRKMNTKLMMIMIEYPYLIEARF